MTRNDRTTLRTLVATCLTLTGLSCVPAAAAEKPVLTESLAHTALAAAMAHARQVAAPGAAIAIVDDGGSVVLLERLDGTFPAGPDISIGKARTAAAFQKPTRVFEDIVNKGRIAMTDVAAVTRFTPLQGGVPLTIAGHIVGAIGVSGAATAAQDDEIAQSAADAFAAQHATAEVAAFTPARIADAFRRGETLLSTAEYSVEAGRRDAPGQAEVHARATDVFYVVGGRAELVTGGTVVDAAATGADETRGRSIEGGIAHALQAGSVMVIPRGTPHWFKTVQSPLTYFVVKSTAAGE